MRSKKGKTIYTFSCPNCNNGFESEDKRSKFCSRACAAQYNNTGRKLTTEHKQKVSESLKKHYQEHPLTKKEKEKFFFTGIKTSKHRFLSNPQNIYELSSRTRIKVLRRLDLSCSICGWNEEICDMHHIRGRKIKDCHNHNNLSYLCPNCHRLAHKKKIPLESLTTMEEQIGNGWKKHYYG